MIAARISLLVILMFAGVADVAMAETRSFVASMFYPYAYNKDGDCSNGLNALGDEQDLLNAAQIAKELGWPQEKIDKLRRDATGANPGASRGQIRELLEQRARIAGRPVNDQVNPQAAPDPHLSMVDGKFAYGFNLDDRGAGDPTSFTDPATGEHGVDNQLFRALGCFPSYRGDENIIPGIYESAWTVVRPSMPAWLITIEGKDLSKDGDVTVTFNVSFDHAEIDAQSKVLSGMTFRVNPNPLTRNVFKAVLKDGVITSVQTAKIYALWGEQMLLPKLELSRAQLRLKLRPNNTLDGIIGGYMPYVDALSEGNHATGSADWVGMYWNLRKAADANPDPRTGHNRDISATFKLEAVAAFTVAPAGLNQAAK